METKRIEESLHHLMDAYNHLCQYRIEGPPLTPVKVHLNLTASDGEMNEHDSPLVSSAMDALQKFEAVRSGVVILNDWADRTRKRLGEIDPITHAPRYGPKTAARMKQLLQLHEALRCAIQLASEDDINNLNPCFYSVLKHAAQKEIDSNMEKDLDAKNKLQLQNAQQNVDVDQQIYEQQNSAMLLAKQIEEENIARLAEKSRLSRLETKRRQEDDERLYEQQLEVCVTKGVVGAKVQLENLKRTSESNEYITAVKALHSLFTQIIKNPENVTHRRIRRKNKMFLSDIGRHEAGYRFLLAAGYTFEMIEGDKCLFLPEPDLEKDLKSWSLWFDSLKDILLLLSTEISR